MEYLGKICLTLITIAITALIGGFVFQTLWEWFIVKTFSVQALSLIQAIGLSYFISYIKLKLNQKREDKIDVEFIVKSLVNSVVIGCLILGFGWVINLFM